MRITTTFLFCAALWAGISAAETPPFRTVELADGVTLYTPEGPGPPRTNSLVIERSDGVTVVDAQPSPEAARLLLRSLPAPPRFLLLSHGHAESAGGASAFPESTVVIATVGTRDALGDDAFDFGAEVRALLGDGWRAPPRPHVDVATVQRLDLDDPVHPILVLPIGRAHSPGDMLIELPRTGILHTGGLLTGDGNPYASDADLQAWTATLTHLIKNAPPRIVGVRGPVLGLDDLQRERDALAWLAGNVEQGFIDQLTLPALRSRILALPGLGERFNRNARPSFLEQLVERAVEEAADHRRKRGRPIPGESP